MKLAKRTKKRKGFTLVELIVVIVILGILAAIAVPRMSNMTGTAQQTANRATARTIISAVQMASVNHNGDLSQVTLAEVNDLLDITVTNSNDNAAGTWGYVINGTDIQVFNGSTQVTLR